MLVNLGNSSVAIEPENVSFHSSPKEKAVPKNVHTTIQLNSFHMQGEAQDSSS